MTLNTHSNVETRLITMRSQPNCFEVVLFCFVVFVVVVVIVVVVVVVVVVDVVFAAAAAAAAAPFNSDATH